MSYWQGRRALVTGGMGFIGANLVEELLRLGAGVRVADNLQRGQTDNLAARLGRIEFLDRDLRESEACREACRGTDVVFHLASRVGAVGYYVERPAEVLADNCRIDTNMLAAAREGGVGRYFYASSVFVYPAERQQSADAPPLREEEALPANPPLSYGWAKLYGEKLLEYTTMEQPDLRVAVLRLIGVYGPYQSFDLERGSIIPVLVRRALEFPRGGPFSIRGSGQETRSYCYVSDVVRAMLLSVEKLEDRPLVGPLNVGSETSIRIIDLANEIAALSGKDIEVVLLPGETAVWGQSVDCSRARQLLDGWRPAVPLREGLSKVYEYVASRLAGRSEAPAGSGAER